MNFTFLNNKSTQIMHDESTYDNTPLKQIESDIRSLMIHNRDIEHKFEAYKLKSASEMKTVLSQYLDIIDAIERIIASYENTMTVDSPLIYSIVENLRLIIKMCNQEIELLGVTPIEVIVGSTADYQKHKIVEVIQDPKGEPETIVKEIKKGYIWNNMVIRSAQVSIIGKVSENKQ